MDKERAEQLLKDANTAKNRLIEIENELWEIHAIRKVKSLGTIICRLESWQKSKI